MQDADTNRQRSGWRHRRTAFALAVCLLAVGSTASAQVGSTDTVRPASIQTGTCDAPGEVVAELRDLRPGPNERSTLEFVGAENAAVVEESDTTVGSLTIADLTGSPHVIVVQESESSDTIIACGEIGGLMASSDDDLAMGLRPQNDSGFGGIANLDGDTDDNEIDVDIYLSPIVTGPAATPAA